MVDLRQGIIDTAAALQMDPVDLATIISYETAGTFDPMKRGPTTKWGQHRGLIQFGEPQAAQHGVDFSSPQAAMMSQLGPEGAIVDYYRSSGWEPGMGMLDAYSIVNAGGPGRYSASDTAAGGAPGTVADKVRQQMGGHRAKAMNLLEPGSPAPPLSAPYEVADRPIAEPQADRSSLASVIAKSGKAKKKGEWRKDLGKSIAGLAPDPSTVGMGEAPQLPQTPATALPAMPTVDTQAAEANRQQMAMALARLNQGRLWG